MDDHVVRLRPSPLLAAAWGIFASLAVALGVFLVVRHLDLVSLAFLLIALAVDAYYLLQLAAPRLFSVVLDTTGVTGRWLWRRVEVPWGLVSSAAVRTVAGEHLLHLGLTSGQQFGLLLPFGADVQELTDTLASRVGSPPA